MTPRKVSSNVRLNRPVTRSQRAVDGALEEPRRIRNRKGPPRGGVIKSGVAAKKSAGRNAPKPAQEVARHNLEVLFSDP